MDNKYFDFEEYIRQGEPEKIERTIAWKTAIGLQDVDGLKTSEYLLETAKENIEGKIDIKTAGKRIESYYEVKTSRTEIIDDTKEADIVSARIAEILGEKTFNFSPVELRNIHKRLFSDILEHAGEYRTYNITKKEWVLNEETVYYASSESIQETLDYDFNVEKGFSYQGLTNSEVVKHIAKFTSGIWQIHPFGEGNTRSTAVFIIKYLRTLGYSIDNDIFAENSWYFRNALVRSNYNDHKTGITSTNIYLEKFFENLLLGQNNELQNRYLHVDCQSAKSKVSKCKICTLEEQSIITEIENNPKITQDELATILGKSPRTIKTLTTEMQKKGLIIRENGKRYGQWKVIL